MNDVIHYAADAPPSSYLLSSRDDDDDGGGLWRVRIIITPVLWAFNNPYAAAWCVYLLGTYAEVRTRPDPDQQHPRLHNNNNPCLINLANIM